MKRRENAAQTEARRNGEKTFMALVRGAENGDRKALKEIRSVFEHDLGFWEEWGDVAGQAERALIRAAAGDDNLMLREGICRKLDNLKKVLVGPSASPLERLLADRVAACWLQVHYADLIYAQNMRQREQAEYFQRRQDRAHKRYLSAIKTLAQVRRLLFPTVQVNIAAQQVNKMEVSGLTHAET